MVGMRRILKEKLDPIELLRKRLQHKLYDPKEEYSLRQALEIATLYPSVNPKDLEEKKRKEMALQNKKSYMARVGMPKSMRKDYIREMKKQKRLGLVPKEEEESSSKTERLLKNVIKNYTKNTDMSDLFVDQDKKDEKPLNEEEFRLKDLLLGDYIHNKKKQEDDAFLDPLSKKSIVLSNAYQFVVKQLEYQMVNPDVSDEDSFKAVQEMLRRDDKNERFHSRKIRKAVLKDTITENDQDKDALNLEASVDQNEQDPESHKTQANKHVNSTPSIMHNKPKLALQMKVWGDRLEAVPYQNWTIGAITALDHWIATNVLEISHLSWTKMLNGDELGMSRINDVISVRGALFPETLEYNEAESSIDNEIETPVSFPKQTIDDLLQKVSSNDHTSVFPESEVFSLDDNDDNDLIYTDKSKRHERQMELVHQLQTFRERHHQASFDTWSEEDQTKLDEFLQDYLSFFVSPHEKKFINFDQTKLNLLSLPPNTKEEEDKAWNNLQDETEIELFLDQLKKTPPSNNQNEVYDKFCKLSYTEQKDRLMTLSSFKPLFSEFDHESKYDEFFQINKDILLENIEIETLVEDAEHGTITAADTDLIPKYDDKKYKISTELYSDETDEYLSRKKDILKAWTNYKGERAAIEAEMYKKGEIGLEYNQENQK